MSYLKIILLYLLIGSAESSLDAYANYTGAINALQYEISHLEMRKEGTRWLGYGRKQLYCASAGLILAVLLNQEWSPGMKMTLLSIAGYLHVPAIINFLGGCLLDNEIELRRKQIERLEIESGVR